MQTPQKQMIHIHILINLASFFGAVPISHSIKMYIFISLLLNSIENFISLNCYASRTFS
jgi:hypothetical protein